MAMVDVDVRVLSYLKEKLAWAVGKWLWVISTIMYFKKNNKSTRELIGTKNKVVLNLKQSFISCSKYLP